jgi:hypothetical protein
MIALCCFALLACLYGQAYSTALNWTEATSFVVGQQAKANKAARLDSSPNLPIALPLHFFCFSGEEK